MSNSPSRMRVPSFWIVSAVGLVVPACNPETDLQGQQSGSEPATGTPAQLADTTPDSETGMLVEPPPGTGGLATNLAALVVHFSEPVQAASDRAAFKLRADDGFALPMLLGAPVACAGACYQLTPGMGLPDATMLSLDVEAGALQFLDGKPVPGGRAGSFATGTGADLYVPRIQSLTVTTAEGCIAVQASADEAVHAELVLTSDTGAASLSADGFAASVDFAARVPELPADATVQATLHVVDRYGNVASSSPVAVALPPALPHLVITEVLANPAGSETTQEMVEIYNAGAEPVALGGLYLADKTGSDTLPDALLPTGGYAVVVGDKYDSADGKDPAPQSSAVLVQVPGRIGSDGLSNAGEVVRLLTPSGVVISQYGGWVDVSASAWSGQSVKRVRAEACDGPSAWSNTPSAPTPGW